MAVRKLSQITPAPSNPTPADQFVAVRSGNDFLFTGSQMATALGGGGGPSLAVAVTPPVTVGNSYGGGYVIGGVLHFANVLNSTAGTGEVRLVRATCMHAQAVSWELYLFNANPTASV